MQSLIKFSLLIIVSCALSACIRPYQPDIQQGNIINNSDLRQIEYGMSKQEVLFILGTPMIIDPFNESRWDYYYSNKNQQSQETMTRLVTVLFDGDTLVNLRGDVGLATVNSLEPSTEDMQHGGTVITKPTHRPKGIFTRLFNRDDEIINPDVETIADSAE